MSPSTDSVLVAGQRVARGSRVMLRPGARRADAQDMFLAGRAALVEAVLLDVDDTAVPGGDARPTTRRPTCTRRTAASSTSRRTRWSPRDLTGDAGPERRAPVTGARWSPGSATSSSGDDAFGVEVARLLAEKPRRDGVEIADFGIRGVHLVYELLDGCDLFVLVDAAPRGYEPGTITVLEVDPDDAGPGAPVMDGHGLAPDDQSSRCSPPWAAAPVAACSWPASPPT